jgi:hypothetical protein
MLVIDIGDTAAHAGRKVPAARCPAQPRALGHVLAAVIAHALHHGRGARVADRKSFPGNAVEKRLAAGGAIEHHVADHNVFFGTKPRSTRRITTIRPPESPCPRNRWPRPPGSVMTPSPETHRRLCPAEPLKRTRIVSSGSPAEPYLPRNLARSAWCPPSDARCGSAS